MEGLGVAASQTEHSHGGTVAKCTFEEVDALMDLADMEAKQRCAHDK